MQKGCEPPVLSVFSGNPRGSGAGSEGYCHVQTGGGGALGRQVRAKEQWEGITRQ